jgi:hypothetical protein
MDNTDVPWQQHLANFRKVLLELDDAVELMQRRELSKLEKQGVIQGFEYCYELGWNTLKDFLVWQASTASLALATPFVKHSAKG